MDKNIITVIGEMHLPTVLSTTIASIVFLIVILWAAKKIAVDERDFAFNVLICVAGALMGWMLGAYIAPFTMDESSKFQSLGQVIALFFSGYFVSKVDRILEKTLFSNDDTSMYWIRLILFISSCLLSTIFVYTVRSYLNIDGQ